MSLQYGDVLVTGSEQVYHLQACQALCPPLGYQAAMAVFRRRLGTEETGSTEVL